jgi:anti-anti-sigma factor
MFTVDLSIRGGDGVGVVALRGEFGLADAPGVASQLMTAVAVCGPSVIVDLAALEGIGYSGLAVLLRIRKWIRGNGGDLLLAAPQSPVRWMLEATGLINVFSVYPSVDEAAGSAGQLHRETPAPLQRLSSGLERRHGSRRRACRAEHYSLARPPRRHPSCRQHVARNSCVHRRPPGGRRAA